MRTRKLKKGKIKTLQHQVQMNEYVNESEFGYF